MINIEGTSGTLFIPQEINHYIYQSPMFENHYINPFFKKNKCNFWGVTTTIFNESYAIKQVKNLKNWCIVVVGDKKTRDYYNNFNTKRSVYLSPYEQSKLGFKILEDIPWNHFGRKNIGYLYAIKKGATLVYDFDDDNQLIKSIPENFFNTFTVETTNKYYNLYPQLSGVESSWPRGFPLNKIKKTETKNRLLKKKFLDMTNVTIIQSLANNDPDVDAIYRLTQKLPFGFYTYSRKRLYVIPRGTVMPYNAQATLHYYFSFLFMLLPCTVHGRVSDIWRSYITQYIMKHTSYRIGFSSPWVEQYRNKHDYMKDFNSEIPLYEQASAFTEVLDSWKPKSESIVERLLEVYILLFKNGFLQRKDVELAKHWIQDLIEIGYVLQ